ncbi:MAG: UvrD-helicase domain-containing protein [Lachnospira sp.]|nr:UvrD-helicase domain-containing protein [Lachnospira sp.]
MNLSQLNDMQRKAVRTTEGPVLLLAGAGSGKTRVLTYRIAYLIESCGVDPSNILAITFTNKAAGEMRDRVDAAVGQQAGRVWVSTFHSACVRILRAYGSRIGYTSSFSIYDTDDQKACLREICKRLEIDTKKLNEKTIMREMSRAKDELMGPQEYAAAAGSDYHLRQISKAYTEYENQLKKNNAMDFDDLIYKTVELFTREPEVLESYQNRFHYIMVDEYQDTNTSQFRLISLLAGRYRNICVVGDDDQSIYRFRGANIYNILNFEKAYPGAAVIRLEQNYRSTQTILDAANAVIANNTERKPKKLWTENARGDKVHLTVYPDGRAEAGGVASQIQSLVHDGWTYNDIAILYRTNAQSRALEERFVVEGIPYRIFGGVNFYSRREIKDILAYLKAIENPDDEQSLRRIINVPRRGIGDVTLDKISTYAAAEGSGLSFWEALKKAREVPGISARTATKTEEFVDLMEFLSGFASENSVRDTLDTVIARSGYLIAAAENETKEEAESRKENLNELLTKAAAFDEENPTAGLSGFLQEVSLVADIDQLDESAPTIAMMTLHSAKGLEFPCVFITGMEEGLFPSYMSIVSDDPKAVEEERRLCYVGITRAQKELYLSAAKCRMIRGETQYNKISRFLKEIPEELLALDDRSDSWDDPDLYERAALRQNRRARQQEREAMTIGKATGNRLLKLYGTPLKEPYHSSRVSVSFEKRLQDFREVKKPIGASSVSPAQTKENRPAFGKDPSELASFRKAKNGPGYGPGDRVSHARFGEGTVKAVEDTPRDYMVTVDFDEAGTRKMMAGFARLKKI